MRDEARTQHTGVGYNFEGNQQQWKNELTEGQHLETSFRVRHKHSGSPFAQSRSSSRPLGLSCQPFFSLTIYSSNVNYQTGLITTQILAGVWSLKLAFDMVGQDLCSQIQHAWEKGI